MPGSLKRKFIGLLEWMIKFLLIVPTTVYASRTIDELHAIHGAVQTLLALAIIAGAVTATFIPTAVDGSLKNHVSAKKAFIGLTFGTFATLYTEARYGLDDMQMLLPAYLLASIGTPLMVYVVGIASDKDTYATAATWLKKRFGMGD